MKSRQFLESTISEAFDDPIRALDILAKIEAGDSLLGFIRLLWPIVEPSRPFIDGWAIGAICEHLEGVTNGQIRKLLINVPPGYSKSLCSSVFWPAWEWLRNPALRYLCVSYSQSLTKRDNARCLMLLQSDVYRRHWGERVKLSKNSVGKERFDTQGTGWKIASSVGGTVTGERGDRVIIDDAHSVKQVESEAVRTAALQWFTEVIPTRINDPEKSAIIVIGQRTHESDIPGLIIAHELGYDQLIIPMEYETDHPYPTRSSIGWKDPRTKDGELAWPERFSRDYLEKDLKPTLRSVGGSFAEASQLQQRPSPRGGGMFKRQDFRFVDRPPAQARRVRGWDLAGTKTASSAYTAAVLMSLAPTGEVYIEDAYRSKLFSAEVYELIASISSQDGQQVEQSIPQDPGQAGVAQKAAIAQRLHGRRIHFSTETGSKETRASPVSGQASGGNLYLVRGSWNDEFVAECCSFPAGSHSDLVDAASRAYARLLMGRAPNVSAAAPVVIPIR